MANNFEYKIHISIDEKGLSEDVKKQLKKIAVETKEGLKIQVTGDFKDIVNQLIDLQKKTPNIDLTKGMTFELADAIKEDSEQGKRIMEQFKTYMINAMQDVAMSIDAISSEIEEKQSFLDKLNKRRTELYNKDNGVTDAAKAYEEAEKRFSVAHTKFTKEGVHEKTRIKAYEEMKQAIQDMRNLENEAGKQIKDNATIRNMLDKNEANTKYQIEKDYYVKSQQLAEEFLNTKPTHNSYSEMISEIDAQILETENNIHDLQERLEAAQNPEVRVKGKLTDTFLDDLQSQLDQMTGIEVKVKPKLDKDVKLEVEVEGDVKPIDSPNNSNNSSTPSVIDEITQAEDRMGNEAQEATNQAKQGLAEMREEAEKTNEALENIVYHAGDLSNLNSSAKTHPLGVIGEGYHTIRSSDGREFGATNVLTGLYTTEDLDEFLGNEWSGAPISKIDISKYKMFVAQTNESADALSIFYSHMADVISGSQLKEDSYHEFEQSSINIPRLYKEFQNLFGKEALSIKDFELFIKNCIETFKANDFSKDELGFDNLDSMGRDVAAYKQGLEDARKNLSERVFNSDSFQTQLMKLLGYEGVDLRGTNHSGTYSGGTVLFDVKPESIISTNEKWSDVMSSNGFLITEQDLEYEKERAVLAKESAKAYRELANAKEASNETPVSTESTANIEAKIDALEREEQAVKEANDAVKELDTNLDELGNHPYPTEDVFVNQKIAAEQSLRRLDDMLPEGYDGEVKQQISDLHTELSQLTEDDGLSTWASKFKIVADNIKDVNNEVKSLKNNLKDDKLDYSLSLDKSLKIKELDKYSAKLKELGLYSDETADKVAELYEKLGSVEDKNDLSIYNKELKLLQSELAEQVQIRQQTTNAKKRNDTNEVQRKIQLLKLQYEYETKLAGLNPETDASSYKIYGDAIKDIERSVSKIILTEEQEAHVIERTAKQRIASSAAVAKAKKQETDNNERENKKQEKSNEQVERKRQALSKRLANLMLNGQIMKNNGDAIRNYFDVVQSEAGKSIKILNDVEKEINNIEITAKSTGQTGQTMSQLLQQRWQSLAAYLGSFASFYKIVEYVRRAVTVVKEFDDALTEMRKVSDESVSSLKSFQRESFGIASQVGSTAKVIQDSTADWMRLGESLEEAKESAKDASILLNVSEFSSIDEATTSLVAMSQAYKDLDKIEIIDKLNNIGNNFSISTDQLSTGLQNAAAVLKTQGNDIDEAIALLTAGNAITQDISKASAGTRTIALRIAGTETAKAELEEMGEAVDDYVVQTSSKTQEMIKAYTAVASNAGKGVDVLDQNGNLRNTYEILLDIAKVYKEIQTEDKANGTNRANALVEYLAGKNRSNIAASILENPELLESVYQKSQNSVGSAMEENEKYLDSISGKMAILQNETQELVAGLISSDLLKFLIDIGTQLVNFADDVGAIKTAFVGLMTVIGSQKLG